jgi:hypothetical protein
MMDNTDEIIDRLVYRSSELEALFKRLENAIICHQMKKAGQGTEADLVLWASVGLIPKKAQ